MFLQISQYNQKVIDYKITSDSVSIGRGKNNDIILPDSTISRTHALIHEQNKSWVITDRSQNGVFVDGAPVQKCEINRNSHIRIGSYSLTLVSDIEEEHTIVTTHRDETQIFSFHQKSKEITLTQTQLVQSTPIDRKYNLNLPMTTIGKDPQNQIKIVDDYISNFHCKIEIRNEKFFIKDLSSTNGTLVNDQKIIEAELSHQDVIKIGKATFTFLCQKETKKLQAQKENNFDSIISQNASMKEVFSLIQVVAPTDVTVFIHGETGTGKELVARAISQHSLRTDKPFLSVNCGAISKDLIESELFGHEKGAFTSAHQQRKGLFEQAHQGTLFLDEIGELSLELQPKLLRVLETGDLRRVGGHQDIHVDVRIIAATHRDLPEMVKQNRFREDLLYRLFVIPVEIPALRDRKEDIEPLVQHFLTLDAQKYQTTPKKISDEALAMLKEHTWPGNIRELKNIVQRAIVMAHDTQEISAKHIRIFSSNSSTENGVTLDGTLADMEKRAIEHALGLHKWNKTKTAQSLGIAKSTLHLKIQQYGIEQD